MAEWDGNESSCSCDCGFDIPKGGTLDTLTVKDISGIANLIYPIGSIYMSVNSVDPSTLFGGTWERIQDRFLLAAGSAYNAGSTGGADSHRHISPAGFNGGKIFGLWFGSDDGESVYVENWYGKFASPMNSVTVSKGTYNWTFPYTSSTSNMPPYLAVYVWRRTV